MEKTNPLTTIDEIVKQFDEKWRSSNINESEELLDLVRSQLLSLIGEVEVASEKMKKESESDKPAMLRELSNEFIVGYNSAIKDFLSLIRGMK